MAYELTVYCLAYNQESYIKKTLESVVSQKTTFPYKVIVHDDASTDHTREIIMKYSEMYPDLIFPILQENNQYSQGIDIFQEHISQRIEGKYIACCECDDYWTDKHKLQMQYEYMERNPHCQLCVHNTIIVNEMGEYDGRTFNQLATDKDYDANEVILAGGGGLFHTSSYFMRKECKLDLPKEFLMGRIGDYPLAIWCSTKDYIHYMALPMSAYREMRKGSWSEKNREPIRKISNYLMVNQSLTKIDQYTDQKYHRAIKKRITKNEYEIIQIERKYVKAINPKYWLCLANSILDKILSRN